MQKPKWYEPIAVKEGRFMADAALEGYMQGRTLVLAGIFALLAIAWREK